VLHMTCPSTELNRCAPPRCFRQLPRKHLRRRVRAASFVRDRKKSDGQTYFLAAHTEYPGDRTLGDFVATGDKRFRASSFWSTSLNGCQLVRVA